MATCPLCSERAGKRYCPAKDVQICAVCCGTKREIEIDCPSSCSYLKASREYEADKPIIDSELMAGVRKYDNNFVQRYQHVLAVITGSVIEERIHSAWLVDLDVVEVYKALSATMKTLSSGIYYESLPDGPIRQALYRRLKEVFDQAMQPQESMEESLKLKEAIDVIDFMTLAAQLNSSTRPKSRKYLDWLETLVPEGSTQQSAGSGLILP